MRPHTLEHVQQGPDTGKHLYFTVYSLHRYLWDSRDLAQVSMFISQFTVRTGTCRDGRDLTQVSMFISQFVGCTGICDDSRDLTQVSMFISV